MKKRVTFIVAATLGVVAAAMAGQHLLYEGLVVPKLAGTLRVPVVWWLATAALGAIGLQAYGQWLAQSNRAGWAKSFAIEAPFAYWTLGILQVFLVLLVLELIGHVLPKKRTAS